MSRAGEEIVEVVCETQIQREEGWLYYLDKDCNVRRSKMQRGGKAHEGDPGELLVDTGIVREDGWLYFMDMDGNVARTPTTKARSSSQSRRSGAAKQPPPSNEPSPHAPLASAQVEPAPGTYRCLSVRQPYADLILRGIKTVEYRTWKNDYRGTMLLHASSTLVEDDARIPLHYGPRHDWALGGYVGLVDLVEIDDLGDGNFGWRIENPRRIPFREAKGKLNLYPVEWPPPEPVSTDARTEDHRSPEDRRPAIEALLDVLPEEEIEACAEYFGLEESGDPLRALADEFRHRFLEFFRAVEDEYTVPALEALGGKRRRGQAKNEAELLRCLRFIEDIDCRDELRRSGDLEEVTGFDVKLDPEEEYEIVDGSIHLVREDDEGDEELELIAAKVVTEEDGYLYVVEDGKVWRFPVKTIGELVDEAADGPDSGEPD